jgi:hypothetical protein
MNFFGVIVKLWALIFIACLGFALVPKLTLPDKVYILHLQDCALPCWIGIVPGTTTIGEARELIQARYVEAGFEIEIVATDTDYTRAYALQISAHDEPLGLSVWLNDMASEIQRDTSIVRTINIYPHVQPDQEQYMPTVVDMMVALGRPACLGVQWGNHYAWPIMLYPQYHAKISFGTNEFMVTPDLAADLLISDEPLTCTWNAVVWRGFNGDYRPQLLRSVQP